MTRLVTSFTFPGIGFASAVIVFLVNCDYNVLMSWSFYYLFSSFTTHLPWANCENDWNSLDCSTGQLKAGNITKRTENTNSSFNVASVVAAKNGNETTGIFNSGYHTADTAGKSFVSDPVTEFWE